MWQIDYDYIVSWLDALDAQSVAHIFAALELLEREGPTLGRPPDRYDQRVRIRQHEGIEARFAGVIRDKNTVRLRSGKKGGSLSRWKQSKGENGKAKWSNWYKQAIPKADALYRHHLMMKGDPDVRS